MIMMMPTDPVHVVATAAFMFHGKKLLPSRLVFTPVMDPDQPTVVVEPSPDGLVFQYKEVMHNLKQAFHPFRHEEVPSSCRLVQVPHPKLPEVLASGQVLELEWDVVGCVDTATYYYLVPILPHVVFLGPAPVMHEMHLLGPNRDPMHQGRAAAASLHEEYFRQHAHEDEWDRVV